MSNYPLTTSPVVHYAYYTITDHVDHVNRQGEVSLETVLRNLTYALADDDTDVLVTKEIFDTDDDDTVATTILIRTLELSTFYEWTE
jgi:hypothetical protein